MFFFSCPGEKELVANKVCSGRTGENLDKILTYLNKKNEKLFPFTNRYDYAILNASNHVNFNALTAKSEESNNEINSRHNLKRIKKFFKKHKKIEYVILCGDKAGLLQEKIEKMKKNIHIVQICHLGFQSLNQIKEDVNGQKITQKGEDATNLRLEVVAEKIWKKMNSN